MIEGDLLEGAVAFAREKVASPRSGRCRRVRDLKVEHPNARRPILQFARNTVGAMSRRLPGAAQVRRGGRGRGDAKPFDEGLRIERELFARADAHRPSRKALRHAFFGRARRLARSPTCPRTRRRARSSKVAVIGAGTMGGGIAMNFLNAGIPVTIARDEAGGARPGRRHHPQELRGAGQEGQAHAGQARASAWRCSRPRSTTPTSTDADLVIEAVFEDMDVKQTVFRDARRGGEAGRDPRHQHLHARRRPDRRVHEAPAGRDRHALLQPGQRDEAARGGARRGDRPRTCWPPSMQLGKKIKKTAVVSGVCDGFIGNRMLEQYCAPGAASCSRRAHAAAGRRGAREVRLGHGPVPHGRPGRQRHRLGTSASAATSRSPSCATARSPTAVRAGPLRPEDRRRLVRLRGRQARRDPDAGRRRA